MPYFEPQWLTRWGDAAFPRAAERRDLATGFARDDAFVDAAFERLPDAPDAADITAVE